MIAIDTNVLVRLLIRDSDKQYQQVLELIKYEQSIFLSHIVLCETVWVLISVYNFNKVDISSALDQILRTKQFHIQDIDEVRSALNIYNDNHLDFADALIGIISKKKECTKILTFDKKAAKSLLFTLIK